jgi:5-methylcytosine-specific restriction endonuclease McrA
VAYHKTDKYKNKIDNYKEFQDKIQLNNELLVCNKCHQELPASSFSKNKLLRTGLKSTCRECTKIARKVYKNSDNHKNRIEKIIQRRGLIDKEHTTKFCHKCQRELPLSSYYKGVDTKLGVKAVCIECIKKYNKGYVKTANGKELVKGWQKNYRQSEHGATTIKTWRRSERGKASDKKYGQSSKGKEKAKKYRQSEKAKERQRRYLREGRYRQHAKEYRQSEKGKALVAIMNHKRRATIKNLPATLTAEEWEQIQKHYKYRCVYCGEKKKLTRDHIIPLSKNGPLTKENVIPACINCNSRKYNRPVLLQLLAMEKTDKPYTTS